MTVSSPWSVDRWRTEVAGGLVALRELDPAIPTRLVYGADALGRYCFGLISIRPIARPILSQAVTVECGQRADSKWILHLTLDDPAYVEVFMQLCTHVYEKVSPAASEAAGVAAALECFSTWHELLHGSSRYRLSLEECRGLFAEITFGFEMLAEAYPLLSIVDGWEGPYGGDQDFTIAGRRYEVKSHHAGARALQISSEYQLNGELLLAALEIDDSRRALPGYISLADLVRSVRARLVGNSKNLESFDEALSEIRYDQSNEFYEELYFKHCATQLYGVTEGFPRITPDLVPHGVGSVRYSIELDALAGFKLDAVSSSLLSGWDN